MNIGRDERREKTDQQPKMYVSHWTRTTETQIKLQNRQHKALVTTPSGRREQPSNILNIDNSKSGWLRWCVPSWTQTINQRGIPEHLLTISPRRELGTNLSTEQKLCGSAPECGGGSTEGRSCCRVWWTWPRWSRTSTLPADGMWAMCNDGSRWSSQLSSETRRPTVGTCWRRCSSWSLCGRCWGWVEVEWTQESGGVAGLYWQNIDYLKNKLQAALYTAVLAGCPSLLSVHVDLMRFLKVSHGGFEEGFKCEPPHLSCQRRLSLVINSNVCISSNSCFSCEHSHLILEIRLSYFGRNVSINIISHGV